MPDPQEEFFQTLFPRGGGYVIDHAQRLSSPLSLHAARSHVRGTDRENPSRLRHHLATLPRPKPLTRQNTKAGWSTSALRRWQAAPGPATRAISPYTRRSKRLCRSTRTASCCGSAQPQFVERPRVPRPALAQLGPQSLALSVDRMADLLVLVRLDQLERTGRRKRVVLGGSRGDAPPDCCTSPGVTWTLLRAPPIRVPPKPGRSAAAHWQNNTYAPFGSPHTQAQGRNQVTWDEPPARSRTTHIEGHATLAKMHLLCKL